MKNIALISFFLLITLIYGCGQDSENTESVVYELPALSANEISGNLTVSKNDDGSATFYIKLDGTIRGFDYPTHLHYGDLSVPNASVAMLLTPTSGDTGISETVVSLLSDDSAVTYEEIITGNFSLKIHLGDNNEDKQIILAASNLGSAFDEHGTKSVAICSSNTN